MNRLKNSDCFPAMTPIRRRVPKRRSSRFMTFFCCSLALCIGLMTSTALGQQVDEAELNPGHNGAWVSPNTGGQGFLLDVMPDTNLAFLAWFTYDTSLPAAGVTAQVGDPGHRWLTAQGPVNGNEANLDVYVTSGGLFDNPTPVSRVEEGDITLTFDSCTSGTVDYRLTSAGLTGSIPIERIVADNVALCMALCGEVVTENSGKMLS